jgi:hypothetical protein
MSYGSIITLSPRFVSGPYDRAMASCAVLQWEGGFKGTAKRDTAVTWIKIARKE